MISFPISRFVIQFKSFASVFVFPILSRAPVGNSIS
jgi:hypothetical protein